MHLIERYALSTGVPISSIEILEHYYPIVFDKYICFYASKKNNLRDYDHWNLVLNLCLPFLQRENIKVVQIGSLKDPSVQCDLDLRGKLNFRQTSNVIKNSMAFVGVDSLAAQIASVYNKPITAIFGESFANCSAPYWGDKKKQFLIETPREKDENPSFILNEFPKKINKINPEIIAQTILEMLGFNNNIPFKTIYAGLRYKDKCIDIIPSLPCPLVLKNVNIRLDLFCDMETHKIMVDILSRNTGEVTTAQPFNLNFPFVKNLLCVNYVSGSFDKKFVEDLKLLGIPVNLICTNEENLKNERAKFFNNAIINFNVEKTIEDNRQKINNASYEDISIISNKKIVCGADVYPNIFAVYKSMDLFLLDLDWMYIYSNNHE